MTMSEIQLLLTHAAGVMSDDRLAGNLTAETLNEVNEWLDDDTA